MRSTALLGLFLALAGDLAPSAVKTRRARNFGLSRQPAEVPGLFQIIGRLPRYSYNSGYPCQTTTDWLKRGKAKADAVSAGDDEMFFGPGLRMMRIVANSVLYLSSANPDVSEGLKEPARTGGSTLSSKEKRRLERSVTKLDYTLVGRSTTPYQGPSAAIGKQLTERIQTRGHWKSQAHGPGRLERKIIFIEPYWRGPDAAEVINKPYVAR